MSGTFDEKRQRWVTRPSIQKCWKGTEPIWNAQGKSFQNQLYCVVHRQNINPDGASCEACRVGLWPPIEALRRRLGLLSVRDADGASDAESRYERAERFILAAVERGQVTEQEAYGLVAEFGLDEKPGTENGKPSGED